MEETINPPLTIRALILSDPESLMDEEISKRLEKIESALAHIEHLYDSLNEAVIEQGSAIKKLKAQQQRIAQTVERMETDRIKADRSRPPHHGT